MKKLTLILTFFFISNFAFGQDTIFLNDKYEEVESFKEAIYYKTIEKLENNKIIERLYLKSEQIKTETEFKATEDDKRVYNGFHKVWYDTGELRFVSFYENGKKNGDLLSYWKNGILKRKDNYKKGKLKKGDCWNENGEKVKYYDFEIHPSYIGGKQRMYQFIKRHMRYPILSKKYNIGGKVIVDFKIDITGKVIDAKIKQSVNEEIDREALRIINSMPNWKPGLQDGIPVKVRYRIPMIFNPN
ncbi:MAG: TonB family protein [Lutibacter sp.]|uniref:energy transducer TonB n=1 Tax=Lutibacter sp. TaxID=1925666 RepID=UPI00184B10AF|nr:energy transducer TonB [Lutibacter sp.]MBT8318493.1 TonB family protein [Lutibacter sp.]NNJ59351.1 TonB family protein [Lutibacter sp.]